MIGAAPQRSRELDGVAVMRAVGALVLRDLERAVDRPFDPRASLRIDRLRLALEALDE